MESLQIKNKIAANKKESLQIKDKLLQIKYGIATNMQNKKICQRYKNCCHHKALAFVYIAFENVLQLLWS